MDRIKIALNLRKPGNYAFFCPVSRLHLTRSNPVGFADGVTSAILMGLISKSLLDVDGVVDLKTGKIKEKVEAPVKQEPKAPEAPKTEVIKEPKEEQVKQKETDSKASKSATEDITEEAPKKRSKKANK
jgi:hypothetical protein